MVGSTCGCSFVVGRTGCSIYVKMVGKIGFLCYLKILVWTGYSIFVGRISLIYVIVGSTPGCSFYVGRTCSSIFSTGGRGSRMVSEIIDTPLTGSGLNPGSSGSRSSLVALGLCYPPVLGLTIFSF